MQSLVKYCKKIHNLKLGSPTIQLGSLNYYRDLDPNFSIADQTEGHESTFIGNFDSRAAKEDVKTHLRNVFQGNGHIIMENCVSEVHFPNSLIYCVSFDAGTNNYLEEARKFDHSYDSYYLIGNIDAFAHKLALIVLENFKVSWFDENCSTQFEQFSVADYKEIGLQLDHKKITYVPKKHEIIVDSKLTQRPENLNQLDRIVFTKEEKFLGDLEYRLLYTFVHPRYGVIPVRKEPVILPISPILRELQGGG